MKKLRYNKTFKDGLLGIIIGLLLFGTVFVLTIVAKIQYDDLVSRMLPVEATIVDIDLDVHLKGPDEQEICVTYEVDGITYVRELETDTGISFSPGRGANYSVGDKIEIFYDPQNPKSIASPRSVGVGYFYMGISLVGLILIFVAVYFMIKYRRGFLVTQEEYEREKEERKKRRADKKKRKKSAEPIENEKGKNGSWVKTAVKVILIVLSIPVAAFVFLLILGGILTALGY